MRDDMDDENLDSDESHAPEALGDDERQALVDELVTAELELQKLACILDGGGHADRRLGDDAHDVHPARLAAERELLASLREQEGCEEEARAEAALSEDSPQEAEGASLLEGASQPEVASPQPEVPGTEESASTCFAEAMAESKCAYESALQDAYDEHLERIANLQEELEASGVSVVSLQALMRAREAELLPTHSAEEIETPSLEAQPLEAQSLEAQSRDAQSLEVLTLEAQPQTHEAMSLDAQSLDALSPMSSKAQSLDVQSCSAQSLEAQSLEAQSLEAQSPEV